MAMEALKSAGIAAYQGSSPKPAVKVVEKAVKPEASVTVKPEKTVEKAIDTAEKKSDKRVTEMASESESSHEVQDKVISRESVKAPELSEAENKESAELKLPNDGVKRAIEEINKKVVNSEAVFGVHDTTNRVTIKIVDKQTKEVIKEYPPEKTLDMIAKVWEWAGLLVDEKL